VSKSNDSKYLDILLGYIRVCADYKPKLGHGAKAGYKLAEFKSIYGADPFYSWLGLDNPLMYAAHKAAGGMTSIYRQIGIGCEAIFRNILQDELGLDDQDVNWSYTITLADGRSKKLKLDACIPVARIRDTDRRRRIRNWIREAARRADVDTAVARTLRGVVFEIRQGYKSKDSKRQNADIANAAMAYTKGFLPCAGILSLQIDDEIAQRYRNERWVILTGLVGKTSRYDSFYGFCKEVVGYDLAVFFEQNSTILQKELEAVLTALLSPS